MNTKEQWIGETCMAFTEQSLFKRYGNDLSLELRTPEKLILRKVIKA